MSYDDFETAWSGAIRDSDLLTIGWSAEPMTVGTTDRHNRVAILPYFGRDSGPFHVAAALELRWDALKAARTATIEDDVLVELFGRVLDNIDTASLSFESLPRSRSGRSA